MSTSGVCFPSDPLGVLQSILGLRPDGSPPLDVIIVALDLELRRYTSRHSKFNQSQLEITEIGVSMLDTRDLTHPNPTCHLVNKHFVVGTHNESERAARKLHFGTSERLEANAANVNECIMSLLRIPDQNAVRNKFRDIVLVGHGISSDLAAMRRSGIVFEDIKTVVSILDTTHIAKKVLGSGFRLSALLDILGIPNSHLHSAGNDANFCLKALLLLIYHNFKPSVSSLDLVGRLTYLKGLGLEPLPNTSERIANLRAFLRRTEDELDKEFMSALDMGILFLDQF